MELRATGDSSAFLDMTHLPSGFVRERFPRIYATCLSYGVNLETVQAPVRPAAHYAMGGVKTDLHGRTNMARLHAAGEVACTGVHGANRLASNSLLEGVVFGARAGQAMRELMDVHSLSVVPQPSLFPSISERDLRAIAWNSCGILRNGPELEAAHRRLAANFQSAQTSPGRISFELRNMHQVSLLISQAALEREESRGGHYRSDFPAKSPAFEKHSLIKKTDERVTFA
jgi:L-aspartate oxidase